MSGLEVAGIVLGSIPLVISALENYDHGLQAYPAWRKYAREVRSLVRGLSAENRVLVNTYEALLQDVVADREIDALIRAPFGPGWKSDELNRRLEVRLCRDYDIYTAVIRDMMEAVEEIKAKLDIGPDGQVRGGKRSAHSTPEATVDGLQVTWMQPGSRRETRRVYFTLNRARYRPLVERLRSGNTTLRTLVRHNLDLEPRRRRRLQARFMELVQLASANMHHSLRASISCKCASSHGLNLELLALNFQGRPDAGDEEILTQISFRVGFSTEPTRKALNQAHLMQRLLIQPYSASQTRMEPTSPTETPPLATKSSKRKRFESPVGTQTRTPPRDVVRLPEMAAAAAVNIPGLASGSSCAAQIQDLCSSVKLRQEEGGNEATDPRPYGYILHPTLPPPISKFGIFPAGLPRADCSLVSLHSLLNYDRASLGALGYTRHLLLAYTITCSVLHHHGTPWLPPKPTSRDFVFMRRGSTIDWTRVFIALSAGHDRAADAKSIAASGPEAHLQDLKQMLLGLGIVLIELLLRRPIDALRRTVRTAPHTGGLATPAHVEALRNLAARVGAEFGLAVSNAVTRCVSFALDHSPDTDEQAFRQEFYATVVAPLEEAVGRAQGVALDL